MHCVYSTSTVGARRKASRIAAMRLMARTSQSRLARIESLAVGLDFCHVCGRSTDHGGEHSDAQLLAWAEQPGWLQSLL